MNKIENKTDFERFLYSLSVFDVIDVESNLRTDDIIDLIQNKREWKDVYHKFDKMSSRDIYSLNEEVFSLDKDSDIGSRDYDLFSVEIDDVEDIMFQVASFWSPRDQSGTTFLATNTSLLLSQDESFRVLLLDFNLDNPNVHLHMSLFDGGDRNLSELIYDIKEGDVNTLKEIDDYLTKHPFHKNLDILIGSLYELDLSDEDFLFFFEHIIEFARRAGYNSVLIDCSSGLRSNFITEVLKRSDLIVMPFLESPGSIMGLENFFSVDGPFLSALLDKNKLFPVLNQSTRTNTTQKISELASSTILRSVYAHIPREEKIHRLIANGIPILNKDPDPVLKREFIKIANCIHDVIKLESSIEGHNRGKRRRFWGKK